VRAWLRRFEEELEEKFADDLISAFKFRILGFELRVLDFGYRVLGLLDVGGVRSVCPVSSAGAVNRRVVAIVAPETEFAFGLGIPGFGFFGLVFRVWILRFWV